MKPSASSLLLTFALIPAVLAKQAAAQSSTLQSDDDHFAWAANLGWIECRPERPGPGDGIRVADTVLSGYAWSDSTGWINFGNGAPANSIRYSNTDGDDSGVNHDGTGNLSGLAWSANVGWITFGWAAPDDPQRPRFDLLTGEFSGCAWCANSGWIVLGSGLLRTDRMHLADSDQDGISDPWELERAGSLTLLNADGDKDGDGATDRAEFLADSDPCDASDRLDITDFRPGEAATLLSWTSRPARLYRIFSTGNMEAWIQSPHGLIAPDPGPVTTRTTPHAPETRLFFRVDALVPLQP